MEELEASELGTLEYWEERYKNEITNFSNHGDIGEVWFGEDTVCRIIKWISKNIDKSSSIADIGCGNGHILIELAQLGYEHLVGLDYSYEAIKLAKAITEKQNLQITFKVNNILEALDSSYDVIHDKGTYDAISLSESPKEACEKYITNVEGALKDDGRFIITSCNWTQNELVERFRGHFTVSEVIPTPQFKFGGKVGSVVSICVFKKNH